MDKHKAKTYIDAAQQHGIDDDPDHEVGDLQEYFRVAFSLLTPEQQVAFSNDLRVSETLAAALCRDEDESEDQDTDTVA